MHREKATNRAPGRCCAPARPRWRIWRSRTGYPPPTRRWPRWVAAYVLLIIMLALPGVPLYYYLDAAHKPLVIRVCTGVLLAFILHRLVRGARERLERQPASDFAAAARPRQEVTYLASPFERWQRQVLH